MAARPVRALKMATNPICLGRARTSTGGPPQGPGVGYCEGFPALKGILNILLSWRLSVAAPLLALETVPHCGPPGPPRPDEALISRGVAGTLLADSAPAAAPEVRNLMAPSPPVLPPLPLARELDFVLPDFHDSPGPSQSPLPDDVSCAGPDGSVFMDISLELCLHRLLHSVIFLDLPCFSSCDFFGLPLDSPAACLLFFLAGSSLDRTLTALDKKGQG